VISDFIFRRDGNILHADEHRDEQTGLFLMRVEFDPAGMNVGLEELSAEFVAIAERYQMQWRLASGERRPRMAILVSQYDHCLADLLYRHQAGEFDCDIPLVISNHPNSETLARFYGAEFVHIPLTSETKQEAERRQIERERVELPVSADRCRMLAAEVADPAATIQGGIAVQYFLPVPAARHADALLRR